MKPFCEVVVTSVLPAIRSIMTRELLNTYGLKQQEVADLLGITQPAVSQYIRESRGMKVKLLEKYPKIMKMIDDLSRDMVHEKLKSKDLQVRMCDCWVKFFIPFLYLRWYKLHEQWWLRIGAVKPSGWSNTRCLPHCLLILH